MSFRSPKHFFSKLASVQTPRTSFDMSKVNTTTVKTDYLYPVYCEEVIPGDTWNLSVGNMIRYISPITVPMMDNLYADYHFWFVPYRLVWNHTKEFFGEKQRSAPEVEYTIPQIEFDYSANEVPQVGDIYDYFEIPIKGTDNILSGDFSINALPFRCYNLIYDEWYRDEQRCDYSYYNNGDSASSYDDYVLLKRGKRFDYFTSSLLEPQIGDPVNLPLGTTAPVVGNGNALGITNGTTDGLWSSEYVQGGLPRSVYYDNVSNVGALPKTVTNMLNYGNTKQQIGVSTDPDISGLVADLSNATPSTISMLRQAFQLQAYNELRARGGNRYTEYIFMQYGVISPDARLQRPEFLGGTHQRLTTLPVIQNGATTSTAPQGNLAGIISGGHNGHCFTRSFTEHGYIIGILNIYSDLTYYQGLDRKWTRTSPLDIALPIFANLSDQDIKYKEILLTGNSTNDDKVFGYAERYAEYKYAKNTLTGLCRPNAPSTLGYWSLAQQLPSSLANNDDFIESDTPASRISAVTDMDYFIVNQKFYVSAIRCLPAYSDPMKWFMRG